MNNLISKKAKKAISICLAAALTVTGTFNVKANAEETATVEANNITVWVSIDSLGTENASGVAVDTGKVALEIKEGDSAEVAVKDVLDKNEITYSFSSSDYGTFVDGIGDLYTTQYGTDPDTGWGLYNYWIIALNGEMTPSSINTTFPVDGDEISIIYGNGEITEAPVFADDNSNDPDADAQEELIANAKKAVEALSEYVYNHYFAEIDLEDEAQVPGLENKNMVYAAYYLSQAGYEAKDLYTAIYNKIEKQCEAINEGKEAEGTLYITTYNEDYSSTTTECPLSKENLIMTGTGVDYISKIALFVDSIGRNPENVGGLNLFELATGDEMYESSYYAYGAYAREGILLQALGKDRFDLPESSVVTKEELIAAVAADTENQITSDINSVWGSYPDSIAMDVYSISKEFEDDDASRAVNRALKYFEKRQNENGGFGNYNTIGTVMAAIGKCSVDVFSDTTYDFIKDGNTLFDACFEYVNPETGEVSKTLGYGDYQLLDGLVSCVNVYDDIPVATIDSEEVIDPVTQAAVETEEPASTAAVETEEPASTAAVETEEPASTAAVETEEPAETEEAAETEEPAETEEAAETEEPAETEEVAETKEPSETATNAPAETAKPESKETVAPNVVPTPAPEVKWNVATASA
ncbi:MAG: DUF4430 domain-containing protein, partial [Lachnospiraceae bacterium]|nr:DUF4430 domain-containing protein [Lachnospiraceae bacterium]